MLLDVNYKELTTAPAQELLDFDFTDFKWNSWIKEFPIHTDSLSMPIVLTDPSAIDNPTTISTEDTPIKNLVLAECAKLEQELNSTVKWAVLICLPAGKSTRKHADQSQLFHYTHRCHLPLVTNADAIMNINGTDNHFSQGHWYEMNNMVAYQAVNNGAEDRIHLMVDLLPNI